MALSSSIYSMLKTPTPLEQLLEEITYQRARELRQCLKEDVVRKNLLSSNLTMVPIMDQEHPCCNKCFPCLACLKRMFTCTPTTTEIEMAESGFVMLNASTFWTDLFVRHFLFQSDDGQDRDDLLFFVRKTPQNCGARYIPKFETEVEVFRKDSKKLPVGDPEIDWEETVYLNLILQQFEYTLTLAICTRTSPKELQILKRHSQKVYASPSRRQMDSKGEEEEFTYPNIFFMIDNFDEIFCDIIVRDGEMVCVELVAGDRDGSIQGVIFQGSIRYEALKRVYDARTSLTTKMAQRMSLGWFQGQQRMEFVRMKGPEGKGHAEMAVCKPKGSGVETPTSEPGFSLTDFDWEDDIEQDYPYMQRRMSDPSSNLNSFVRGWRSRPEGAHKSRSENEGLDSYANGYNEIEAGDLRDVSKSAQFCDEQNALHAPQTHKSIVRSSSDSQLFTSACQTSSRTSNKPKTKKLREKKVSVTSSASLLHNDQTELDDTTYNRLWMMRGFSQAYHFWKESRRAQSVALHAYLTYVTLSWHHIISDLLENRQPAVLTF